MRYFYIWVELTSGTFQIKFKFHTFINSSVSDKKRALSKMSFYQQNTISLYSWFLLVLSCNIFLTFHGSIFLNIKLGPTTTWFPRRRGRGLYNPDCSHDQILFFWLAEDRNFTNIMIECGICEMALSKKIFNISCQIISVVAVVIPDNICASVNTLKPEQNGWHFADDILKCIFLKENFCILIKILLKFLLECPIFY